MVSMGPRLGGISLDEACEAGDLWGKNPVHPSQAAYKAVADAITADAGNPEARYSKPPK
jgi:hypothetical protein